MYFLKLIHHGNGRKRYLAMQKKGLVCFSSVFDETSVDFLSKIGVHAYKISSFEINHHPLFKKVAREKKSFFCQLKHGIIQRNISKL